MGQRMKMGTKNGWIITGVVVTAAAGILAWRLRTADAVVGWRSARVDRGDVIQRIQATGTLNALIQVPVGTQVSGVVTALYADFNSLVKKGQILARIDPALLETQLADARAAADGALGTFENAKAELERYRHLATERLISESELNTRETAFRSAQANLASTRAALARAGINLDYCTIKAPVDGVVVSRVVDVGQTVAASLSAPSLFTVAQDLSRMKLQAAIDEADIGQVRVGQRASFTVDSYPDQTFEARVSEVQLNPTISSNVVTYNVVLGVSNMARKAASWSGKIEHPTALYIPEGSSVYQGDLALFPGMTANVSLMIEEQKGVLRVPNAALRFTPESAQGGGNAGTAAGSQIWVLENGAPKRLVVRAGLSDGRYTEVSGPGISEGMSVLIGSGATKKTEATAASPIATTTGAPPPPPN